MVNHFAVVVLTLLATSPVAQGELSQCLKELAQVLEGLTALVPTTPYEEMATYSGKGLNDLGDYYSCCVLSNASYALFSVFISTSSVYFAVCGPKVCTKEDYLEIVANFTDIGESRVKELGRRVAAVGELAAAEPAVSIVFPQTYIHDHFTNLSAGAVAMLVVCVALTATVAAGTVIDFLQPRPAKSSEYQLMPVNSTHPEKETSLPRALVTDIFLCFSLRANLPKLFASRSAEKSGQNSDTLDVLNAVRVMSMGWVILGHVYIYRFILGAVKNPLALESYLKDSKTAIVYAGLFSVDSFFWLSGLLMAFLTLQQLNTKRSITGWGWAYLYAHRFYRILPAYMFVLFLTWAFTKYIGNGPLWFMGDSVNTDCKRYWWTNLLFLNNFLPDGHVSGCLGQTWYLANDMQFFLISPPLLFLYHRVHRLLGWALVGGLCVCAVLSGVLLSYYNHYSIVFVSPANAVNQFIPDYYVKPYCRVGPYAVGIACGMVLYSYRLYKRSGEVYDPLALWFAKVVESRYVRYCAYSLGLFLINFFIFMQYSAYKDVDHGWTNWNRRENAVFIGFSRTCWAIGISLLVLPMLQGFNAVGAWFLSLGLWSPLARLTFCTYLIHLHFVYIVYLSQNEAFWFNDLNIVSSLVFIAVISYAAAVPLTLFVESPFMAFEKMVKSRRALQAPKH